MNKKTYEEVRIEIFRICDGEIRAADFLITSPGGDENEGPGFGGDDLFG